MTIRHIAMAALATSSSAFTIGSHRFYGGSGASVPSSKVVSQPQPGLSMAFGSNFFDTKIDYSALDHPGPELAKYAEEGKVPKVSEKDPHLKLATFAGGCFWGIEILYQRIPGVAYTCVGYSQGSEEYPQYEQVCAGATDHTESVIVYYDPNEVSYDHLLDAFFGHVDPTTVNGQGGDRGKQYRTGVYFHTHEQEKSAKARFAAEKESQKEPIATELKEAMPFWPAEKYHQQYLEKGGQNAEKGASETIRCYG